MGTRVRVNVHPEVDGLTVREFPDGSSAPFVEVILGGGVSLLVSDPEVMAGLVHLVTAAEQQLNDLLNGAEDQPPAGEPVGDTGLILGPYPVGLA